MNVVDSSGWLEYFADAENATFFESAIEDVDHLVASFHQSLRSYLNVSANSVAKVLRCRPLLRCSKDTWSN